MMCGIASWAGNVLRAASTLEASTTPSPTRSPGRALDPLPGSYMTSFMRRYSLCLFKGFGADDQAYLDAQQLSSSAALLAADLALGPNPLFQRLSVGQVPKLPLPDMPQEHNRRVGMAEVISRSIRDAALAHLGDDVLNLHLVREQPF